MATLESSDANIVDAETINLRLIVYPLLAVMVLLVGGFGYYYYQQNQRDQLEAQARAAMLEAKTPEALVKVADQFPGTDQGNLALLSAGDLSYQKKDYASAIKYYKRVISGPQTDEILAESARLGFAASLEAANKPDDESHVSAADVYLVEARRGKDSPYAPYAYTAAAAIYAERGDKDNERKILNEAVSLDPDAIFVKQAQARLKELNAAPAPSVVAPS